MHTAAKDMQTLNVVAVASPECGGSSQVWSAHGCRVQVAAGGGGWALSFYWGDEVEGGYKTDRLGSSLACPPGPVGGSTSTNSGRGAALEVPPRPRGAASFASQSVKGPASYLKYGMTSVTRLD